MPESNPSELERDVAGACEQVEEEMAGVPEELAVWLESIIAAEDARANVARVRAAKMAGMADIRNDASRDSQKCQGVAGVWCDLCEEVERKTRPGL